MACGRFFTVKAVRFTNVVRERGQPEVYLALIEPAKDRILQVALKAQGVMTALQTRCSSSSPELFALCIVTLRGRDMAWCGYREP